MDYYYIKGLFGEADTDPMLESYTTPGYIAGLTGKACPGVLVTGVAMEVLHGIVKNSETKANQRMKSSFEKMPPISCGYSGQTYFEFMEEIGITL